MVPLRRGRGRCRRRLLRQGPRRHCRAVRQRLDRGRRRRRRRHSGPGRRRRPQQHPDTLAAPGLRLSPGLRTTRGHGERRLLRCPDRARPELPRVLLRQGLARFHRAADRLAGVRRRQDLLRHRRGLRRGQGLEALRGDAARTEERDGVGRRPVRDRRGPSARRHQGRDRCGRNLAVASGRLALPADLPQPEERSASRPRGPAPGHETEDPPLPRWQLHRGKHDRHALGLEDDDRLGLGAARPPEHSLGLFLRRRPRPARIPPARPRTSARRRAGCGPDTRWTAPSSPRRTWARTSRTPSTSSNT